MRPSILILLSFSAAAGCAHENAQAKAAQTGPAVTTAYRDVRSGAKSTEKAQGVRFCATDAGLEAVTAGNKGSSELNDYASDRAIESEVKSTLKNDPALRGSNIQVKTTKGEVALTGQASSDQAAVQATRDALGVSGVVFVNVALTSPESPQPPARMQNPRESCLL
jgi:osmotically-inducible protein OsmY